MRLIELDIDDENVLKQNDWKMPEDIAYWLEENGYELVGSGAYSMAYTKRDSELIIKISLREDKCWLNFADVAQRYQHTNRHFPNITSIKEYKSDNGRKHFIAIMEKLYRIKDRNGLDIIVNNIRNYVNGMDVDIEVTDMYPELFEAIEILYHNMSPNCMFDIHHDNLMQRKNGDLVLMETFVYD